MKIDSVSGMNFGSFHDVTFSLNNKGLVCLMGENKDDTSAVSNGAGKSTLPDLINWVLWGTTARGSKGDSIIRRGTKAASGSVRLIEDLGAEWLVSRARHKAKETLHLERRNSSLTHWVDNTQGTNALTQAMIEKVLGCTEDVFRAAVYVGQEDLPDLPAMTDKQLKEIIERAAGVDVLERALKEARVRLVNTQNQENSANNERRVIEAHFLFYGDRILDTVADRDRWDEEKSNRLIDLDAQMAAVLLERQEAEKKLSALPDSTKLNAAAKMIMGKLAALKGEEDEKTRLERAVATAESVYESAVSAHDRAIRSVAGEEANLAAVQGRIGTPCGECGTSLTEDHLAEVTKRAEERVILRKQERELFAEDSVTKNKALAEAQRSLAKHVSGMSDASTLHAQNTKLAVALRERQSVEEAFQHAAARGNHLEGQRLIEQSAENPFVKKLVDLRENNDKLGQDLKEQDKLIEEIKGKVQIANTVVQVFGPSGVRAHMLDEVTPYLNDRTAEYLSTMSDGNITAVWSTLTKNKKGEYKERFAIDVAYNEGGNFTDLSGGQKRKVRIACALALQDLVASRASKPIDLWIADEIDTALDSAGLERLMMVLQMKASERGTVVAISHSDLRDWISNVWTVTLEGGVSTLEIAA